MSEFASAFHNQLLDSIPKLRAGALAMCRDSVKADDIVQDVLLKAWEKQDDLENIETITPWLFAILRNTFRASFRRRKFESDMPVDDHFDPAVSACQELSCEVRETLTALEELSPDQREIIVLVCFQGLSYEQTAVISNCPIGTVKSRLNRARRELKQLLNIESEAELLEDLALDYGAFFKQKQRSAPERRSR